MAVKPLTQFPVHLEDFLEEKYCKYKGVRTITVRKVGVTLFPLFPSFPQVDLTLIRDLKA